MESNLFKVCRVCGRRLPIGEFYEHPSMADGHDSVCKECRKDANHKRYLEKRDDPEFIEKERKRGREKYYRLYANKHLKSRHPENKNTRRMLKARGIPCEGMEVHHWNYFTPKDFFLLGRREHKFIHKSLKFDVEHKMFTYGDVLLDTIEKHEKVIRELLKDWDADIQHYSL